MTKRIVTYFCLSAFLLAACGGAGEKKNDEAVIVKVSQVKRLADNAVREYPFISKPFKETDLSFRVGGPVECFEAYAGNFYKRGDVIAEIDSRDFRIRKERAEAVYNQANAEFNRISALYRKDNLSASTYEKARADYTSAKTAFETASNELDDTRLLAPFDGYIGEVHIEKFQDVKASQPIVSFIDIGQLKVEAYVSQDIAFNMQNTEEMTLVFDARPDTVYRAKVAEVSKSTTRNNLSYLLTALLQNKDGKLLAGMSGKIQLHAALSQATDNVLTIPQEALCHRPSEGNYVWVVDMENKRVNQRKVEPGALLPGGDVIINAGLQPSETVARSSLRFLSEGTTVEFAQESQAQLVLDVK